MAKEKRKLSNLHKIKIHDNRWLAWSVSIAILATIALVGYIKVSDIYFHSQFSDNIEYTSKWHLFKHKTEGYSLRYPNSWALENEDNQISFVNLREPNQYFSVAIYDASQEETLKASLFSTSQTTITVNGTPGVMISQGRKHPESVVMMKSGSKLYVLRGKGDLFEKILSTFKLQETFERI